MNHPFYLKSSKEQRRIQLKIAIVALFIYLIVLLMSFFSGLYMLLFLSIIITISIIAPFFDIPSLKESGKLIYFSSLFVAEKENNRVVKIHGGSLFDYVFVIDKTLNGKQRTNFIVQKYLEGILNLIENYEKKGDTSVVIKGTSYILNERTAEKLGLKILKTYAVQKFILIFNYANILISNSIAKRKISFPKLKEIKTFESSIEELIKRKEYIKVLNDRLLEKPY